MKVKLGLAVLLIATGAAVGLAVAQPDIIVLRQQLMKTNGQAAKVAVGMIRGDIPFDATVAAAAAASIAHDNTVFPELFPAGSETGETKAGEAIWSDVAGFKAASAKVVTDANAAAAAAAQGKDAFAAAFGAVGQDCQACHEKYRKS